MPEVKGSVLVVGGGVAGIRAASDLTAAGFKVYLLDKDSAIGGKMAQLDKTFPTNDCAMCILSPWLVDIGRNLNIEIITNADLLSLEGKPGRFIATIRRRPRYVDEAKCTACGDCTKVCPITVPDEYNAGFAQRRAIYKLYPQAVPNAFAVSKLGISPCKNACPAETSAQGYIALITQRRYKEALEVIKQYNPFPATVGRVCTHPCEDACNRGKVDEPIAICALKRFVADYVYEHFGDEPVSKIEIPPDAPKVAVVGSGPAGLSCAHQLVRMGYRVTVFEALPVPGGMMRVGIPPFRLPREILEREINNIIAQGVELKLNHPVRDINSLFEQGYKAVFLAIGAHEPQELGIPGEDAAGVYHGVPLLRAINLDEKIELGHRAVVIGGGNTALDVSRTLRRLGVEEVIVVYRRSREEMPANPEEVRQAEEEGVKFLFLASPLEVITNAGRVKGVRFIRNRLGKPDASGRRQPEPIPGSEFVIDCDMMVAAVALAPEISFLSPDHGLVITPRGTIMVDPDTLATNRPGIFAGGDAVWGPRAVIHAIADGRRAAISIDRYLRGLPLKTPRQEAPPPVVELPEEELRERVLRKEIKPAKRVTIPTLSFEKRLKSFEEVELTLDEEAAVAEALRCLACAICSECYQCVEACQAKAVTLETHQAVDRIEKLEVGAVVLAPGYKPFDPSVLEEYGFGRFPNVVTSIQFERLLSASGPTEGHVVRPSDGRKAKRIAWLQCIGSRDQEHDYCSSACCMYATKQAIMAKEHEPDTFCQIFLMDMRAFGKGYMAYFNRAKSEYGIVYTRSRISALFEDPHTRDILIRYQENGNFREERFDLVVLSVGMEIPEDVKELAQRLGIKVNEYGFVENSLFDPLGTGREGIFASGVFSGPKDIPSSVVDGSAAAGAIGELLASARGTEVAVPVYPPEIDVSGQEPRIGVFVCHCGSNIAGFLDVEAVTEYARTLPGVVYATHNLYTCSQDTQELIKQAIKEHNLNRVVVASCTPRTHEPLFQDTIRQAGLNPFLFEMANIRDQCSWVHSHQWEDATEKAKDLVRMSVARAARLEPLHTIDVPVRKSALVIGGGVAGMTAALSLARQGFPVHLVEREKELGGNLRRIHYILEGEDPQAFLEKLVAEVTSNPLITVHLNTRVVEHSGFVGNFFAVLEGPDGQRFHLEHGVTIVATGGVENKPQSYFYGQHPSVLTQQELEEKLARGEIPYGPVVMVQCADDLAEKYCSGICCTQALKNALKLKELQFDIPIYILHRDIRVYGLRERYYTLARRKGVLFIRYDEALKPQVEPDGDGTLRVRVRDAEIGEEMELRANPLVLSTGVVPSEGVEELGKILKVPLMPEGFFWEAHIKLRPVDFASDGIFMAGVAHWPKHLDETIVQAKAAAARAATILAQDTLKVGGIVAVVSPEKCTACLTCVRVCPYNVPRIEPALVGAGGIKGAAYIEPAQCHGCGICVAECPAKAIQLMHYRDDQIEAKVEALFEVTLQ
ncbi:MAG: FAD-dependent oxidoreductase [Anaerolineae bacterium]|nr:FAD-dependent oxidoreductase [Anaerolineae bacterium]MDW8101288.1 FAD-dependent oxidoreductase [Anaerolineae bacterium]